MHNAFMSTEQTKPSGEKEKLMKRKQKGNCLCVLKMNKTYMVKLTNKKGTETKDSQLCAMCYVNYLC